MSDLEGICMIVREREGKPYLVAADINAEEKIGKLAKGKEVIISMRKPRHPEHHRRFFWMLALVIQNTDKWSDVEELLESLKIAVGHTVKITRLIPADETEKRLAALLTTGKLFIQRDGIYAPVAITEQRKIIMALQKDVAEYTLKTKSINFASMGQDEFEAFYTKCANTLAQYLGWDPRDLMTEVAQQEGRGK